MGFVKRVLGKFRGAPDQLSYCWSATPGEPRIPNPADPCAQGGEVPPGPQLRRAGSLQPGPVLTVAGEKKSAQVATKPPNVVQNWYEGFLCLEVFVNSADGSEPRFTAPIAGGETRGARTKPIFFWA